MMARRFRFLDGRTRNAQRQHRRPGKGRARTLERGAFAGPSGARILRRGRLTLEAGFRARYAIVVLHLVGELHRSALRALGIFRQRNFRRKIGDDREGPACQLRAAAEHADDARRAQLETCLGSVGGGSRCGAGRVGFGFRLGIAGRLRWCWLPDDLQRNVLDAEPARPDDQQTLVRDLDRLAVGGGNDRPPTRTVGEQDRRPRGVGRRRDPGVEPRIGGLHARTKPKGRCETVAQAIAGQ